jgi:hypothetical protein
VTIRAIGIAAVTLVATQANADTRPSRSWIVGLSLGRADDLVVGGDVLDDQLLGIDATRRAGWLGANANLQITPTETSTHVRASLGLTARVVTTIGGHEVSYGIGFHGEARLRDHVWLAYAVPIELGATVYRRRSFELAVFAGVRRIVAGDMIQHFIIDPNGFPNAVFEAELAAERHDPWEGFVNLVIARRID